MEKEQFSKEMCERTLKFGADAATACAKLPDKTEADILGEMIVRCASLAGASYRAACKSSSGKDFLSRLEETERLSNEAKHLMEVLQLAGLEKEGLFNELVKEAGAISQICGSAIKSTREKFTAYKDKNKKENLKAAV
ncbi:MAG: hypothetical protein CVV21_10285 [Candidatus Goldiibacteriota bacterium HGW-Goldbacteria-1]|jgi:four helix bundle protein|nr:MAG: hypothetical protein CVV21_10285 [Candidatus Goldiibacteriota bacterium HGW-Goldbacteria-1]